MENGEWEVENGKMKDAL